MGISPRAVPSKDLLQQVRAEYQEMSSLRLTPSQPPRLFGLADREGQDRAGPERARSRAGTHCSVTGRHLPSS